MLFISLNTVFIDVYSLKAMKSFCTSSMNVCFNCVVILQTVPVISSGLPISDRPFTRTSLLGFVGPVSSTSLMCRV